MAPAFLGSILIGITAVGAAMLWWGFGAILVRSHRWAVRPPRGLKLTAVLSMAMLSTILLMTASVWIRAAAF